MKRGEEVTLSQFVNVLLKLLTHPKFKNDDVRHRFMDGLLHALLLDSQRVVSSSHDGYDT
ncbi:MAG: hypothetical protein IKJ42_09815 [Bacteroidaceae bacterium]|nr:hypothetical protein [Bacteroidaceae bacterium]